MAAFGAKKVVAPVQGKEAERHRSRTCLASGYDAVLVLKV
jgi:CTP:molybdopterin cytidylyltransferase MocA